jgi:hypothetical protein
MAGSTDDLVQCAFLVAFSGYRRGTLGHGFEQADGLSAEGQRDEGADRHHHQDRVPDMLPPHWKILSHWPSLTGTARAAIADTSVSPASERSPPWRDSEAFS